MDRMITMPPKHCSLGHEKQQVMDDSEVLLTDIISQLPDHVLVHILSLLTMKEAGRTSILSNRWRYLWTYYPNLTFDVSQTLSSLMYEELNEEEVENALAAAKHAYLNWVNQVVRSHRGPTIDQFMVQFGLNQDYSNQINEWVQFAFKMNVQRLTLDFFNYYHSFGPIRDGYCFPDTAVLHRSMLGISNSLTSLRLIDVNVTGEVLQWFLSTCLLLESVVVHGSTTLLNLEAHSTSLKSLEFVVCMKLTSVVVDAPNLVSFAHVGQKIGLQLSNSRKLTDMALGGYFCNHVIQNPLEFYSHLSQLEALKLDIVAFEELILAPEFPLLARLKRLEVVVARDHMSLLGFTSMIKASPMLYEVTFKLLMDGYCSSSEDYYYSSSSEDSVEPAITEIPVDVPHNSLKVVNLVGFVGAAVDVKLALNLIKNSVVLEKMILDTRSPGTTVLEFEDTEEREAARERAGHLATKLPPGVVSVII